MSGQMEATPHSALLDELIDSRVAKTEREHAAAREIVVLRARVAELEARIEQAQKQEPVAWLETGHMASGHAFKDKAECYGPCVPLYAGNLPAPAPVPPAEAKVADGVVLLPAEATDEMQDNMRQALIDQGWDSDSAGEVDFADLWHAGVYEYQERMADMLAAKAKEGNQ